MRCKQKEETRSSNRRGTPKERDNRRIISLAVSLFLARSYARNGQQEAGLCSLTCRTQRSRSKTRWKGKALQNVSGEIRFSIESMEIVSETSRSFRPNRSLSSSSSSVTGSLSEPSGCLGSPVGRPAVPSPLPQDVRRAERRGERLESMSTLSDFLIRGFFLFFSVMENWTWSESSSPFLLMMLTSTSDPCRMLATACPICK